jgi:hypothetical protein
LNATESQPQRKHYSLCVTGTARIRVPYAAIDWIRTAKANGVTVADPVFLNRIGAVAELATV